MVGADGSVSDAILVGQMIIHRVLKVRNRGSFMFFSDRVVRN
jgi:hypothetical protein